MESYGITINEILKKQEIMQSTIDEILKKQGIMQSLFLDWMNLDKETIEYFYYVFNKLHNVIRKGMRNPNHKMEMKYSFNEIKYFNLYLDKVIYAFLEINKESNIYDIVEKLYHNPTYYVKLKKAPKIERYK